MAGRPKAQIGAAPTAKLEDSAKALERLRRLSVVFAYDLRLTAVTELYLREMSPTEFYKEFGGGSVSRVERHFKKLVEFGWLRLVREESGGRRRGGREHFYRATELAIFEHESWSLLPYSVRVAFSWTIFRQLAERFQEASASHTLEARPDRRMERMSILLDRRGWERVIAALESLFDTFMEEQAEARLRIFESGETPFLVTTGMAAFELPDGSHGSNVGYRLVEGRESLIPTFLRISKVCADEVCLSVLNELNVREMSVTQFRDEIGGASKTAIRHRFDMLESIGWLARVGKRAGTGRRGPREHVYRAAGPLLDGNDDSPCASDLSGATGSGRVFEDLSSDIKAAIRGGTLDARFDRHLNWSLLLLDERGWENVIAAIGDRHRLIAEEQDRSKLRLAESGEAPVKMTVALMAFESPKNSTKAP